MTTKDINLIRAANAYHKTLRTQVARRSNRVIARMIARDHQRIDAYEIAETMRVLDRIRK